jgi:putative ABC transport system permease protein
VRVHPTFVWRQITTSPKQTAVFVACVALSLVTLVSLGGFGQSVQNSLLRDARRLLAGDIVVESGFPFTPELTDHLDDLAADPGIEIANMYGFITIVRIPDSDETLLTELKVVDRGYPFYGEVVLASAGRFDQVLLPGQIVVGQALLDRLSLQVGDSILIGEASLQIADVLISEPDQPIEFFSLGPRIFLNSEDLDATGLIRPGSRVRYRTLLAVADESQLDTVAAGIAAATDPVQERVDTFRSNQSTLQIFFEDFLTLLNLIGIFTLFLAGIGIQSSLGAFIREREDTIAVLRTFGATGGFIIRQFYLVALILGVVGTLIGLGLGLLLQALFPILFSPFLPPQVEFILAPQSIIEGTILGFFVVTIFTLMPIYQVQALKPRFVFRKESLPAFKGWFYYPALLLILLFLTAMTYRYLQNLERTAYFSLGIVVLIAVLGLFGSLILAYLRRQRPRNLALRQAIRGLFRPRNATLGIIVTLSASLTVLFTIFLIERNLDATLVEAYPPDAPNVFILDIQPDQRELLQAQLDEPGEFVPIIRARIRLINGVAFEPPEIESQSGGPGGPGDGPQLGGIVGLTYRDQPLAFERLVGTRTMFAEDAELAQVSIAEDLLLVYPFEIGDRISFDVQGVVVEAEVSSIRAVQQEQAGFAPRFNFVFRPQDLERAPQTIVTAVTVPKAEIAGFQNALIAQFPNLTVINISAAIDTLAAVVGDITSVARFFMGFSIIAGLLIILSSVLATRFARIQESVYFKVLGARQRFVLRVFALENIFIGLLSAVLALGLSQIAGWLLVIRVFELEYTPFLGSSLVLVAVTVLLVTAVGLAASVSILRQKPITFLREQTVE